MNKQALIQQIFRKKSFLCVGVDTDLAKVPQHLLNEEDPIFSFNKAIIDATGRELNKLENLGKAQIVVTSPIVRMYFKRLTEEYYKDMVAISYNEIESNVELQSVGMVTA